MYDLFRLRKVVTRDSLSGKLHRINWQTQTSRFIDGKIKLTPELKKSSQNCPKHSDRISTNIRHDPLIVVIRCSPAREATGEKLSFIFRSTFLFTYLNKLYKCLLFALLVLLSHNLESSSLFRRLRLNCWASSSHSSSLSPSSSSSRKGEGPGGLLSRRTRS